MIYKFILQTIKELILGDKEIAKYYYKWRRIKRFSNNGMFRGMFEYYRFNYLFQSSIGGRDIQVKKKVYKKHWNRPVWKHIRAYRFYLDDYKCVYCGRTTELQCHHLSYDSLDTDKEIQDCRTVCNPCHQQLHGIKPKPKRKKRSIFK